jgi:hypothetical protein
MQNSDSNNSNNWLIALLAAIAIYFPLSSIPSSPDQQSSAQPQTAALIQMASPATPTTKPGQARVSGEAAKLLCDFLGARPVLDQDAQGRNSGRKQAGPNGSQDFDPKNLKGDYCRVKDLNKLNIEYLVATVPDPKDSRLDHLFDRYLDAIRRAVEAADYTLDRYWLPWGISRPPTLVVLPADQKMPQMEMETRHLYEPGVILFRNSNGGNGVLLLFLVGETPTGGIHKFAFRNALSQIEELDRWRESKTEKELRIISPSFSGSDASLVTIINTWMDEHKNEYAEHLKVRVVSGAAIAVKKELLENITPGKVSFQATVVGREQAECEFYNYLHELDSRRKRFKLSEQADDGPQIALLSEASTASGQRARPGNRNENLPAACALPPVLYLTFPLHISRLRVEAAKIGLTRAEAYKTPTAKAPDLALPMREAGSPTSKDIVPLFSRLETVTMDLTLDEALSEIHREGIRYVGVIATDVQDRIFLVREIREHCPNATIFIHGNDLLYLHSESNPDFQGTLVISTYPLFALNQVWTYPFDGYKRRSQFSTHGAQGLYNATLALLNREKQMVEYGLPLHEYEDGENRYPALWLGIVGRNGIWPVKTFDVGSLIITEQSWESLKESPESKDFPPDALEKLRGIIGQKFNEEKQFLVKVKEVIGDSQTNKHKELLLEYARNPYTLAVEPKTDEPRIDTQKKYPLGLSANYLSPTGIVILLPIGVICLILPLVFLIQSILFWGRSKVDKSDPHNWRERQSGLGRAIIRLSLKLEREIKKGDVRGWQRPLAWVRGGWPWRVFGDEEFYRYRTDRRIYLISCCVSLVTITLFISSGAILPAWISCRMAKEAFKTCGNQDLTLGLIAGAILALALLALCWLLGSINIWRYRERGHIREYILVLLALFGPGLLMIVSVFMGMYEIFFAKQTPEQVFFFLRATELASGVSVLLPGLLILLATFLSILTALRRLYLAEQMPCLPKTYQRPGDAPQFLHFDHAQAKSFKGLKALEDSVKEIIVYPDVPGVWAAMAVIFILYWLLFLRHFIPSVDGWWFDFFFELGFYLAPALLAWAFLRFVWLWAALRRLLRRLSWHPLISQYAARHSQDKPFTSLQRVDLMTPRPTYTALSASARQARSFYDALRLPPEKAEIRERIRRLVEKAEHKLSLAHHFDAKGAWPEAMKNRRDAEAALAELTEPVTTVLEDSWHTSGSSGPEAGWRDKGRFFLITHITAFLQHVFGHLQNLVALVTVGLLLMLFAANSYPFRPSESLLLFSWVTILASVFVTLFIFVQVNRDRTLDHLAGRTPGKLNITRDFVFRVLVHGAVPLIALLGVQFPQAVRQIISWLSVFERKGG